MNARPNNVIPLPVMRVRPPLPMLLLDNQARDDLLRSLVRARVLIEHARERATDDALLRAAVAVNQAMSTLHSLDGVG